MLTKQQTYRITNYAPASWPGICRGRRDWGGGEEERGGEGKRNKEKKGKRRGGGGEKKKRGNKLWFRSNETRQFNWTFPSDAFVITNLSELFHAVNTRFVMLSFFFLPPPLSFQPTLLPSIPAPFSFSVAQR